MKWSDDHFYFFIFLRDQIKASVNYNLDEILHSISMDFFFNQAIKCQQIKTSGKTHNQPSPQFGPEFSLLNYSMVKIKVSHCLTGYRKEKQSKPNNSQKTKIEKSDG